MKWLATGYTKRATNQPVNFQAEPANIIQGVVDEIRALGHDVDQRATRVGEDLSGYDALFVTVLGPVAWNSSFAPGALWAIGATHGKPALVYFDDWNIRMAFSHHRTFAKMGYKQLLKHIGGKWMYNPMNDEEACAGPAGQVVIDAAAEFATTGTLWQRVMPLIPFHPWGTHSWIWDRVGFHVPHWAEVNPSAIWQPDFEFPINHTERYRRYSNIALTAQDHWVEKLNLTWPVDYYGARKLGAPRLKGERQVLETQSRYWATLQQPYYHAGSGWYRPRHQWAAAAGSVAVHGREDAVAMGPEFSEVDERRLNVLEQMTDVELECVVESQRRALLRGLIGPEAFRMQVEAAINAAVGVA